MILGDNKMILEELRQILRNQLHGSEFRDKTWFAGGCVRDYVLSPEVELKGDIDLTVELKQGGIRLAEYLAEKLQIIPGRSHPQYGTASLEIMGLTLEFVATRKESYRHHSRYPKVSFGSLLDDVLRRDFTINSLLLPLHEGEISDLSGMGLSDLEKGVIRSMGEPELKFREDPLRMLRALRFALRVGYEIEPKTLAAMRSEAAQLKRLTKVQITRELDKMNYANNRPEISARMEELGWLWMLERMAGTPE